MAGWVSESTTANSVRLKSSYAAFPCSSAWRRSMSPMISSETRIVIGAMRVGIADHLGWAVSVRASANHEVVDRRRIELVEPGMSPAPIHYESRHRDVASTAALVAKVRASVVRASSAALDEIETALPAPVRSISLRAWPLDFPDDIAVQRRAQYEARADEVLQGPRTMMGPPWTKDHRIALAAAIVAG
jgi:hypothetical protein